MKLAIARKVLACLVLAAMVVGLAPAFAYADLAAIGPAMPEAIGAFAAQDAPLAAGSIAEDETAEDTDLLASVEAELLAMGEMGASSTEPKTVSTWSGLENAVKDGPNGQVIKLSRNITGSKSNDRIKIKDYDVIIDLNGYTLSHGLSSAVDNGHVIEVYEDQKLTIRDSSARNGNPGTGKITGGYSSNAEEEAKPSDAGNTATTKGASASGSTTASSLAKTGDILSAMAIPMLIVLAAVASIVAVLVRVRRRNDD